MDDRDPRQEPGASDDSDTSSDTSSDSSDDGTLTEQEQVDEASEGSFPASDPPAW